jgi:phage terminase small subunit
VYYLEKLFMGRRLERKASEIEELHGRKLTNRQREFARHFVDGTHSNAECARLAGYAEPSAKIQAHKLLDASLFPHVAELISELREDRERKYGVTLMGQLKRLRELSEGAEENGQYSAAINAEKTRAALGGLTIDRREMSHFHSIENMSREQIEERLIELRKSHPSAFVDAEYEVLNGAENRDAPVEKIKGKDTLELAHNTD